MVNTTYIYMHVGITSIVAQFVEVDQYRWPGWFLFALGILYTVTFLLVYREDEKIQCQCHEKLNGVESVTRWRGQVAVFKTIRCGSLLVVSFMHACQLYNYSIQRNTVRGHFRNYIGHFVL